MNKHAIVLSIFLCSSINHATVIPTVVVKSQPQKPFSRSKITITRKEFLQQGSLDLPAVLQTLSQVQLKDSTGNGSQVTLNMRGFGSNAGSNSLILLNNSPLINPDLAAINLNNIPLNDIERIEISSGSEGILHGDQAVGGIINIFTTPKKDGSLISCSHGSYDLQHCVLSVAKHLTQLSYAATLLNHTADNYRVHNHYEQSLIAGQANYKTELVELLFRLQMAKERMQYPGPLTALQVRENRRESKNNRDYFNDWNQSMQLNVDKKFNDVWKFSNVFMENSMHGNGILFAEFSQTRHSYFAKPQIIMQTKSLRMINGAEFQSDDYSLQSAYGLAAERQNKYSAFHATTFALTDKLKLHAGARLALQENVMNAASRIESTNRAGIFSLGVSYNLNPDLQGYLRRAGSYRFPKADENASTDNHLLLKTQRGESFEGGIKWRNKTYESQINLYQLNLQQEIAYDPQQTATAPFGSNRNLPPTSRTGMNLHEKISISENLIINGLYDLVHARFNSGGNTGKRIPQVAEQVVRANMNYKFHDDWSVFLEGMFTGNQYSANDDANKTHKIGGATVYNCNISYTHGKIVASARLNNIFNKQYYLYSLYQPSTEMEYFYPAAERNFVLTLSYKID